MEESPNNLNSGNGGSLVRPPQSSTVPDSNNNSTFSVPPQHHQSAVTRFNNIMANLRLQSPPPPRRASPYRQPNPSSVNNRYISINGTRCLISSMNSSRSSVSRSSSVPRSLARAQGINQGVVGVVQQPSQSYYLVQPQMIQSTGKCIILKGSKAPQTNAGVESGRGIQFQQVRHVQLPISSEYGATAEQLRNFNMVQQAAAGIPGREIPATLNQQQSFGGLLATSSSATNTNIQDSQLQARMSSGQGYANLRLLIQSQSVSYQRNLNVRNTPSPPRPRLTRVPYFVQTSGRVATSSGADGVRGQSEGATLSVPANVEYMMVQNYSSMQQRPAVVNGSRSGTGVQQNRPAFRATPPFYVNVNRLLSAPGRGQGHANFLPPHQGIPFSRNQQQRAVSGWGQPVSTPMHQSTTYYRPCIFRGKAPVEQSSVAVRQTPVPIAENKKAKSLFNLPVKLNNKDANTCVEQKPPTKPRARSAKPRKQVLQKPGISSSDSGVKVEDPSKTNNLINLTINTASVPNLPDPNTFEVRPVNNTVPVPSLPDLHASLVSGKGPGSIEDKLLVDTCTKAKKPAPKRKRSSKISKRHDVKPNLQSYVSIERGPAGVVCINKGESVTATEKKPKRRKVVKKAYVPVATTRKIDCAPVNDAITLPTAVTQEIIEVPIVESMDEQSKEMDATIVTIGSQDDDGDSSAQTKTCEDDPVIREGVQQQEIKDEISPEVILSKFDKEFIKAQEDLIGALESPRDVFDSDRTCGLVGDCIPMKIIWNDVERTMKICSSPRVEFKLNRDYSHDGGVYVFDVRVVDGNCAEYSKYPPLKVQVTINYPAEIPVFLDLNILSSSIANEDAKSRFEFAIMLLRRNMARFIDHNFRLPELIKLWTMILKTATTFTPKAMKSARQSAFLTCNETLALDVFGGI